MNEEYKEGDRLICTDGRVTSESMSSYIPNVCKTGDIVKVTKVQEYNTNSRTVHVCSSLYPDGLYLPKSRFRVYNEFLENVREACER